MPLAKLLAAQLRRPSGRFGRWVMTRALNRGNADLIEECLAALELCEDDTVLDVGFGGGGACATGRSDVAFEIAVVGPVSIAMSTETSGGGT